MLLDTERKRSSLKFSYFNKEGKTAYKEFYDVDSRKWEVTDERDKAKDPRIRNWDGRPVKKTPSFYMGKFEMVEFIEKLPEDDKEEMFQNTMPNIHFIDIEVEVTDGFPHAELAENPITTIAIVNPNKTSYVLGTKDLTKFEIYDIENEINLYVKDTGHIFKFTYIKFDSEYDMLHTFLSKYVRNFPVMSGWNVINFDWTYIINRCKRLSIDPGISSPGDVLTKDNFPLHVGIIDYMEAVRKWDRSIEMKENFTLDFIASAALKGLKKIKYNGTLDTLYRTDFKRYVYYNVIDTILVYLIDQKLKTLEIMFTLSNICKISLYKASAPVTITESMLCRKFLERNQVMAFDKNKVGGKAGQYAGAYVKKPFTGRHRGLSCFDFASLYPSIMREINVSPEAFIEKLKLRPLRNEGDTETIEYNMNLIEKSKSTDRIIAINGVVYQKKDSILKLILNDLYSQRKVYKKKYFTYESHADKIEHILKDRKTKTYGSA
jgi:DNA polymerase elongation subunit (family B)